MQEKTKEPEIRFAGFTGAWEQRVLGDFLEVSMETNSSAKFDKNDVLSISGDYGVVNQIAFQGRSFASNSVVKYGVLHNEDIVYTKSPLKANPYGIIKTNKGKAGIVSPLYAIYHPKNNLVPSFVQSYFEQNERLNNYLRPLVNKGAKNNMLISNEKAISGKVIFPSRKEQEKISALLERVDSLLTLHQRKYEKLLNIKKSMLEKMFPKEGEVVPEIRFKGFTGAWEQRKFSKLYKRSSEKNDGSIGIERNITVATMQFKSDIRLSSDDYLKTYFTFKVGDIAFEGHQSKEFRYGRFVENDIGDGVVSHIFTVFRPIQRFDLHFWKYAINSENLMQKILSRSTKASTMMHDLVPEDFLNETFLVPSIDEQKAVGKFLHQIDNLLTLHQRKLEMLKNVKQAFLEKMFV